MGLYAPNRYDPRRDYGNPATLSPTDLSSRSRLACLALPERPAFSTFGNVGLWFCVPEFLPVYPLSAR
jgi:hypothetical protein